MDTEIEIVTGIAGVVGSMLDVAMRTDLRIAQTDVGRTKEVEIEGREIAKRERTGKVKAKTETIRRTRKRKKRRIKRTEKMGVAEAEVERRSMQLKATITIQEDYAIITKLLSTGDSNVQGTNVRLFIRCLLYTSPSPRDLG